jgi:CelD/BcsL family acetyltransferase involved in cellulose biosynthesis
VTARAANGVAHLTLLDALERCGPERWDPLVASSRIPSPFMRWAWHDAWARSAAPDEVNAGFALVLAGDEEAIRGILPLTVRPLRFRRMRVRALTWATRSVGCPDHLDVLAIADAKLESAIPSLDELGWDLLLLTGVAEEAPNIARLVDAFAKRGCAVRRTFLDSCPYLDLPGDWDAYLASLSPTRRQTIRRKERRLIRDHAMTVTDYAPDRLEEGWRHLHALHDERWAGAGALGPRVAELLRRFSSELAARDELWLTTLDLDGQPAAAWYGFAWFDTIYFYQGGRDPKWASHSVGAVLMGAMIRRAIERGYRRFDFLRGRDEYKLSWTTTQRPIYEIVVFRPGWRGAWLRGLDLAGRMVARLRRRPEYASIEG